MINGPLNDEKRITLRFLAPQIPDLIYEKYFSGKKMYGTIDNKFLGRINGPFICLTAAVLCHTLRAWKTGSYLDPNNFKQNMSRGGLKR